ncbi:MAG TPA: ferritin-like domain-containing protein [Verrucomicrobiae bacterium]|nr:ferritin-like domain-containing protein [Verrucomicrobiae bacterium]
METPQSKAEKDVVFSQPFLADVDAIRRRARQHIQDGAVTQAYHADRETILKLLNEALATEIVCVLRYKRHYFMAQGIHSQSVAAEFQEHAAEEQEHADQIAERIAQLGGEPDLNPEGLLSRSHSEYLEGRSLLDMVKEDLIAERIAIESYTAIVQFIADKDPTTRRIMEGILQKEEEHADDLAKILSALDDTNK